MTLLEQVKQSFKWKQSNYYCATKLGISVEKYKELKREIKFGIEIPEIDLHIKNRVTEFKEDLEKGTAEIKGISVTEPRSAEEIIELLKIDTTKWKLSSYWNKERHDGWFISAMVTAIKHEPKDILAEVIANFTPKYQHISQIFVNEKFDRDCVGIISTQDLHFGKDLDATVNRKRVDLNRLLYDEDREVCSLDKKATHGGQMVMTGFHSSDDEEESE